MKEHHDRNKADTRSKELSTAKSSQPVECELCQDREIIVETDDQGLPVAKVCSCKAQKAFKRLIKGSGMTDEQLRTRIEDYKPTPQTMPMFKLVKRYLGLIPGILQQSTYSKGMALLGSYGIGKTMLAAIVANKFLEHQVPVIFVPTPELIGDLRVAQFSEDKQELENKIHALSTVPVIVFDDLGKEKITDWVQAQYFRIIDARYRNKLATIITSNYSFEEISEKLGEAVSSRLLQMTRDHAIDVVAGNYRLIGG
jgi:DNA replication protein DnaC